MATRILCTREGRKRQRFHSYIPDAIRLFFLFFFFSFFFVSYLLVFSTHVTRKLFVDRIKRQRLRINKSFDTVISFVCKLVTRAADELIKNDRSRTFDGRTPTRSGISTIHNMRYGVVIWTEALGIRAWIDEERTFYLKPICCYPFCGTNCSTLFWQQPKDCSTVNRMSGFRINRGYR